MKLVLNVKGTDILVEIHIHLGVVLNGLDVNAQPEKKRIMKKIKVWVNTGFAGARHEDEFEFEDDATDKEIDAEVLQWVFNKVEYC